ncbi:MAG: Outer-membrane lipoprotein carrier protein [Glaciecola sp. HTCC2999]|nr:MAG: Outer-membrane lipoprotein carrier protein [Glaciecola sp. HTCC2999]
MVQSVIAKLILITSWVLISVSILFTSVSVFANNDTENSNVLPRAKITLRHQLAAISSLQSTFTQTVKDEANNTIYNSSGNLVIQQPDRVYWQVLVPDETLLVADGNKVFYVDEFVEQVSIFNQSQMVADNPLMLLTSTDDEIWKQFTVLQDDEVFIITPLIAKGQIQKLTLQFNQGQLAAFTLIDSQAQRSEFVLSNIKINMPLPISQFQYDIPSGYSIDDQTQP